MFKVILFAGTAEGRRLAAFLGEYGVRTLVCTATEYGGSLISEGESLQVSKDRLDKQEMQLLLRKEQPELVIDATHPYAREVTENLRQACQEEGAEYLRLLRRGLGQADPDGAVFVDHLEDAIAYLEEKEGRILATTGSKEIQKYTALTDYQDRVVARVLSTEESVSLCREAGFEGRNLICMQGPFTREMNRVLLEQYDCRYLVTKMTGAAGGYEEKLQAARDCGVTPIVVGAPEEEEGTGYYDCLAQLCERFQIRPEQYVALVGIGMGTPETLTLEGAEAIDEAELIIGAGRMVDGIQAGGRQTLREYDSDKICAYIQSHPEYRRIVVLLSGDVGFYSGAKKLHARLDEAGCKVFCIPGISSVSCFMSRIRMSWDDAVIVSNHGKGKALIPLIRDNEKVFSILGKKQDVAELAGKLTEFGLENVKLFVGERLTYQDEKITSGGPEEFIEYENDPLAVVCVLNKDWQESAVNPYRTRRDEEFIRGDVPMTKEAIRALSVDRLDLKPDETCYDVGAGTGSVSIEMAIRAGLVYAIEKEPEAVTLIEENKKRFRTENLEIIAGTAPEALADLPAPDKVFIGGSSGRMEEIVKAVRAKNPRALFVVNCIALESAAAALACAKTYGDGEPQVLQIQAARGRNVAGHTMMRAENPITIITFKGKEETI